MINLLHTFSPQAILFSFGPITVYWYGLLMVLGILVAFAVSSLLAKHYNLSSDTIFDLSFWLIVSGIIGARVYDDFLQLPYYIQHPWQSIEIWKGGLAIHGGIIAGILIVWWFARQKKIDFWKLTAVFTPGLVLAQAIGRWGNYFNQEIFGLPTNLPWGIPINLINRPPLYLNSPYFQPTFLYESLGCLLIGLFLLSLNIYAIKNHKLNHIFFIWSTSLYLILYSLLRFLLEFIRLDPAPEFLGLRWPQFISLIIIILTFSFIFLNLHVKNSKKQQ
ncbi:MAG: prolipoprotein diacylglyceryl transferase [Patescibacteria group bacterium]|jgi:phosphatidylglycerol:prolipoprotein diacylglycerol transferase